MMTTNDFGTWLFSSTVATTVAHAARVHGIVVRICECGHDYEHHHPGWAYGLEVFACEVCGCPEYSGA